MTEVDSARRPNAYTSRRTEAQPKTTLFGSALEIQSEESARRMKALDVSKLEVPKTPPVRGTGLRFTLPEEVKKGLPGAIVLAKSKQDLAATKDQFNSARANLKQKEEQVLYSFPTAGHQGSDPAQPNSSRSQWLNENDLKGSKEINILGLNTNQSFNRDKYGRRPPIHNYSLIGDILRPGMDFPRRERTVIQMRNSGYGMGDLRGALVQETNPPPQRVQKSPAPKPSVIEIPPNIKHQFGSRVCDRLLSDEATVAKTLKEQEECKAAIQRKSKPYQVPKFSKELAPDYEMLGNALRMNVVPGYTMNHNVTTTKTAFNDQAHLFRNKDPDKFRYQKDELSRWAEHNVLRQRMTKAWEQYFVETLQKKKGPE